MTGAKVRLTVAVIAFAAWIGVLIWTVSQNGKVPVVSRAQLTAAQTLIVADVMIDGQGLPSDAVTVKQTISGKAVSGEIRILNLPNAIAAGTYRTPLSGPHLIAVVPSGDGQFNVAGLPPSPAMTIPQPSRPTIYPWVDDVKKQLTALGIAVP